MKHIHIISPSGAIDPALIAEAACRLRAWGYRVSIAPHACGRQGRFAAADSERVADVNAAFADPDIDIILCSRGGYGLQRIAGDICIPDGRRPLLVGFSDITLMHSLLGLSHVPSLHASMCKAIAGLPDSHPSIEALRRALDGGPMHYHLPPRTLQREGMCDGILIGGNLSVLYGLQGTPYSLNSLIDRCTTPPILFIEDIGERHYHIDRMMRNLAMSSVLARIGGLVVGQFSDCPDDPGMGCGVVETICQAVKDYDYPVVTDFPAGHTDDNMPLMLNAPWHLSVTQQGSELQQLR